jgi:murein DD-endopeptidase MepM/ murein hydrolase activator NlpD
VPGGLVLLITLIAGAGVASAQDVELPPPPASTPAPGAAPAPTTAAPAPTTAAPVAAAPRRVTSLRLSVGSSGSAVRDLQRELRRRGMRIAVDGAFGPATKRAVARMQARFKMPRTGVAEAKLLKRLGLRTRAVAAAPTVAPVAPGTSEFLKVFPVAGENSYFDDFGDPRPQGRHEGIDIMADRGTPVVAVDDASISKLARAETGLGGIYVWLRRADGVQYYYAHLNSVAEGLDVGSGVGVGQVIGTVGNTGDARHASPHLHFEIRRGWSPTNPYPHLVAVDPAARTSARAGR